MITRIAAVVELTDSRSTCDRECSSCMRWGSERRLALVTLGYQSGGVLYLCDACADRAARATASAAGPDWRAERSSFEVYTDTDGQRSIRQRSE